MPSEQYDATYLEKTYQGIAFRIKYAKFVKRLWESMPSCPWQSITTIPCSDRCRAWDQVLVSLGVNWLGWLLSGISILTGIFKNIEDFRSDKAF